MQQAFAAPPNLQLSFPGTQVTVGLAVGDAVGDFEGVTVGLPVGETVGDFVGVPVGVVEGAWDGDGVLQFHESSSGHVSLHCP